jgi:hypothetical protein
MAKIYRLAKQTVAWLGKPGRNDDISLLEELFTVLDQQFLSEDERAQKLIDNPDWNKRLLASPQQTRTLSVQIFNDQPAIEANIDVSASKTSSRGAERRQAVVNFLTKTGLPELGLSRRHSSQRMLRSCMGHCAKRWKLFADWVLLFLLLRIVLLGGLII